MYIVLESIPENGSDYISIEIAKGNMMYHNCLETECNIYCMKTWREVYLFLLSKKVCLVEPSGENIHIDVWVLSGEYTIKEWN